jgi:trimethylamine-N-oxide reductase (cytochrome c)
MVVLQHKCIEPLGESKSDYQIFLEILHRMGLGALYSEGCSEIDWVKRVFDSSDLPKHVGWREFVRKGYFVVPPEPEATRDPVYFRWYAEIGRRTCRNRIHALPVQGGSGWACDAVWKIEFVATTIRARPDSPGARAQSYSVMGGPIPSSPPGFRCSSSSHALTSRTGGKDSAISDIDEHRAASRLHYWVLRMSVTRESAGSAITVGACTTAQRGPLRRRRLAALRCGEGYQASAVFDPVATANTSPTAGDA